MEEFFGVAVVFVLGGLGAYFVLMSRRAYFAARGAGDLTERRRIARALMREQIRAEGALFLCMAAVMSLGARSVWPGIVFIAAGLGLVVLDRFIGRSPIVFVITGTGPGVPALSWSYILGAGPDAAEPARAEDGELPG